ncbi:MAG: TldD/PmbA family protein [bacterium]
MNEVPKVRLLHEVDTARVLKEALSRGGSFADLFAEEKASTLIEIEAERVERLIRGSRSGAGVRVIHNHRTSYSYSDLLAESALLDCARTSSLAVKNGEAGASVKTGPGWSSHYLPVKEPPADCRIEDKLDIMWKAEKAARNHDKRIRQVRVIYSDQLRTVAIADNSGEMKTDAVNYVIFYVVAIAGDDTGIQVAHESLGGTMGMEIFHERDPEEMAVTAARRAVANLEARPAPGGTMPVVLASEAGGTMIHEAIGHGIEADLAEQGLSVYCGRVGEEVASPLVTVVDDATLAGKRGTFSIDDEASPAQRTVLVENGVLKGYMYDKRMAMKYGLESTGNGRKESYAHPPIVRMSNTMIEAGESKPEDIIASVDRGFLVRRMGGGQVNTVNGDFVFEVEEGWLIENGAPSEQVRGATLTGNGPRVLKEIDMVGDDPGFGIGTCGKDGQGVPVADAQPTLRIPEIVVGGRIE